MSFSDLGLRPSLCTAVERLGYREPTPVQLQAIPIVLGGSDLIARAQTGTGKTAAFGLPTIERLLGSNQTGRRRPRALVLVPTRELALQVHESLSAYGAEARIRAIAIFGGVGMPGQLRALSSGADIIVATPGRLIDHIARKSVDLGGLEVLVLDEADRMLDMGFQPALRRIIPALPSSRQTLLFSATLSDEVLRLSASFTRQPKRVDVSAGHVVAATVTHHVHAVSADAKRSTLTDLLRVDARDQALVFCRTKRGSDRVGRHLEQAGIGVAVIHGNKSQNARTRALSEFKSRRVSVLVATDIAARGLDIEQLPLVINYDLPLVPEDYVHRVGRTGRAGRDGRAVSLVSKEEMPLLRDIQRLLPVPIAQVGAPHATASAGDRPSAAVRPATPERRHGGGFGRHTHDRQRSGGFGRPRRPGSRGRHAAAGRQPA